MKNWLHDLAVLLASLWVGGMWVVAYLAVPALFQALPQDRMLAGELAGRLFTGMAYVGIVCSVYLLVYVVWQSGGKLVVQRMFWLLLVMLLLTLLGHFGLQQIMAELKVQALPRDVGHSEFAARFRMMHGAASIIYLLQSLLGAILVLKLPVWKKHFA